MMSLEVEWPGLDRLTENLLALEHVDLTPYAEQCEQIIVEGNRRGVLAGVDGNNQTMPALQYRDGRGKKTRNRRAPNFGTTLADATGFGPFATGLNDNLTTAQYQELTGPRLAPRREQSRVIKNLFTRIDRPDGGTWVVVGAWMGVASEDGTEFLPFHFDGEGRNPRYDLRPVRDEDMQFCRNALEAFAKQDFFLGI